jgi:hypothetical protein
MEHGAKTDSDLARPTGGDHAATQQVGPSVLTWSATRSGRSAARQTSDLERGEPRRPEDATSRTPDSGIEEELVGGGPGPAGGEPEQEDRAWIR